MFVHNLTFEKAHLLQEKIDPHKERELIAALKPTGKEFTVCHAIDVLCVGEVGTTKCIPTLKKICSHSKLSVQHRALHAVATLAGASEISFYRQALASKTYRAKSSAVHAITAYGDESDAELLVARLKKVLATPQNRGGDTELFMIARFLEEFPSNPIAQNALIHLRQRLKSLDSMERSDLLRLSPTLNPKIEWIFLILPEVEEKDRLRNIVMQNTKPFGLCFACVSDLRFKSALKRWLPLSKHIVVLGKDTARQARAASVEFRKAKNAAILELPKYVDATFTSTPEFLQAARAQETPLIAKLKALR